MSIDFDRSLVSGKRVLCAVSGGADSMCLLHLLKSAGIEVTAAHFEHGIRGEESIRDLNFVRDFCAGHDIAFVFEQAHVPAYAARHGMSMEEAARVLRYEFLEKSLKALHYDVIATAHNADDNAETMVFNLVRGSGTAGMRGIPRRRGNIVRPLIDCTRAQIESYLAQNAVPHVEDSTNRSDDYTRNLIRHRLMPVMREINPRFVQAAGRTAELSARDEDCLSRMADDFIKANYKEDSLPLAPLATLHPAVSSRVLRTLLPRLQMEHVDKLLGFVGENGLASLDIPGRTLRREQGRLYLSPVEYRPLPQRSIEPGRALPLPECGLVLHSEICIYGGEVNELFKTSYLKYEMIGSNLRVTARADGDKLRPLGRGCTKSLKALFMEHKYPQHKRDCCPVIRDDNGPLLVYGLAVDERTAPVKGEKTLKISFTKFDENTGEKE